MFEKQVAGSKAKEVEEKVVESVDERVARIRRVFELEQQTLKERADRFLAESRAYEPSYDCEEDAVDDEVYENSNFMDFADDGFAAVQQRMADWRYSEYKRNKAAGIASREAKIARDGEHSVHAYRVKGCTRCSIGSLNEVLEASFIEDKRGRIVRRDTIVIRPFTEEQKQHMFMWQNLSDVDSNGRPILWMDEEEEHNKEVRNCPKLYKLPPFPGFPETKQTDDDLIWYRMFQGGVYWDCDVYGIFNIETLYENDIVGDENRLTFVITVLEPVLTREERIAEIVYKEKFMRALYVDMTAAEIGLEPYYGEIHGDVNPGLIDDESNGIVEFLTNRLNAGLALDYGEKPQMFKPGKKLDTAVKANLNIKCQAGGFSPPTYTYEEKMRGNAPMFHAESVFAGERYVGTYWHPSKQAADCEVAALILEDIERWMPEKESSECSEDELGEDLVYRPEKPEKVRTSQPEAYQFLKPMKSSKDALTNAIGMLDHVSKRGDFLQGVLLNQQQLLENSIAAGRAQGYITQSQMMGSDKFTQSLVNKATVAGASNATNNGGAEPAPTPAKIRAVQMANDSEDEHIPNRIHGVVFNEANERKRTRASHRGLYTDSGDAVLETTSDEDTRRTTDDVGDMAWQAEHWEEFREAYEDDEEDTSRFVDAVNVKHLEQKLEAQGNKEPTEEDMIKLQNLQGKQVGMPEVDHLWSPDEAKEYIEKCQEFADKHKNTLSQAAERMKQLHEQAKQNKASHSAPIKEVVDNLGVPSVVQKNLEILAHSTAMYLDRNRARAPRGFKEMNFEMMKEIFLDWLKDSYQNPKKFNWYSLKQHIRNDFVLKGVDQKFWDYAVDDDYRQRKSSEALMKMPIPEPVPVQIKKTEQTETFEKQKVILEQYERKSYPQKIRAITDSVAREAFRESEKFAKWWLARPTLGVFLQGLVFWAGISGMTSFMSFALAIGFPPLFSIAVGFIAMVAIMSRGYAYAMFISYALSHAGLGPWVVVWTVWTGITVVMTLLASAASASIRWRIRRNESAEMERVAKQELKEQNQGLIDDSTRAIGEVVSKIAGSLQFPARTVSNLRSIVGLVKDFPSAVRVIAEFWSVYFFNPAKYAAEKDIAVWFQEEVGKLYVLKGLKGHEIASRVIPSGFTFYLSTKKEPRWVEMAKDLPQVPLNRLSTADGTIIFMKKDDIKMQKHMINHSKRSVPAVKWEFRAYDWLNRRVLKEATVSAPGIGYSYPMYTAPPSDDEKGKGKVESAAAQMNEWFTVATQAADILNDNEEQPQSFHLDAVRQLAAQFADYVGRFDRGRGMMEYLKLRKWWTITLAAVGCAGFAFVSMMIWSYLKKQEKETESATTVVLPNGQVIVDKKEVIEEECIQVAQANVLKYDVDADFEIIKVRSPDGKYFGYDPDRINQEYAKTAKPGDVVEVPVWSNKGARKLKMIVTESGEHLQALVHKSGRILTPKISHDDPLKGEMKSLFGVGRTVTLPPKKEPQKVVSKIIENKSPVVYRSSQLKSQSIESAKITPVFESQQSWKSTMDTRVNYCIYVCDRFVCQVTKTPHGLLFNKHFRELPDLKDGPLTLWNPRVSTSQAITWDWSKVVDCKHSKDMSYFPLSKSYSHLPCVDGKAMEMVELPDGTYSAWIMGYDPDSRDGVPFMNQIEVVKVGNELHYFTDNKSGQCMSLIFLDSPKKQLIGWHKSGSFPGRKCTADAVTREIIDTCYSGQPDRLF